ncbi:ATP-binding protein [Actinacidiphila rubida]|uniref:Anti-sigma regulatory factor (Ser/Thr protein kinase) n=1 Tax=Actinacidiphila rubida TaxID=310780 RepID=A0A1H8QM38_9ACTN|nr:ATP-binding protein [Actinacidiphila rubida]SEO55299.1 Anti-sigma regulatory factor (Ser/Thr protein kinase) [Actinacidiphila rubida]
MLDEGMSLAPLLRDGASVYTRTLPREAASAALARRVATAVLTVWSMPEELTADAGLILNELVSNAAEHATRGVSIRVTISRVSASRMRLAVIDMDPHHLPALRAAGPEDENGRGLRMVAGLADRWDVDRLSWGKRVWAEVVRLP